MPEDLHGGFVARYRRVRPSPGTLQDDREAAKAMEEFTDGIVHMVSSEDWLTLQQVVEEAERYNSHWVNEQEHFMTDPLAISEALSALIQYGYVEMSVSPA